jgi:hypothetical protein
MLELTKKSMPQFNEKFDWSKGKIGGAIQATTSYAGPGILPIDDGAKAQATTAPAVTPQPDIKVEEPKAEQPKPKVFSFDDIKF